MSARPGLCGGHRATGVPTAIDSYQFSSSPLAQKRDTIETCVTIRNRILGYGG